MFALIGETMMAEQHPRGLRKADMLEYWSYCWDEKMLALKGQTMMAEHNSCGPRKPDLIE